MLGGELELDAPFSAVSQDRVVKGGLGLKGGDIPTLGKGTQWSLRGDQRALGIQLDLLGMAAFGLGMIRLEKVKNFPTTHNDKFGVESSC